MSVQFGRWNFEGKPMERDYLEKVESAIRPYGPDGRRSFTASDICIQYAAFHTTKESHLEEQPHIARSGAVITWDGRLDNRTELLSDLRHGEREGMTDIEIVAAAYDRWGTDCFARLIGDWALAIWSPRDREVILAKDFLGSRHLYYSCGEGRVLWSTILDPLVSCTGQTFELCEEYIAGWLFFWPAAHLSPYQGIHAVPPSSFVLLTPRKCTVKKYWKFDPARTVCYSTDGEYEEHFRTSFALALSRRLRAGAPVLAELSGGMDSSSIVSMADSVIAQRPAEFPRLDTVSYYNDSEPNWNERPYFTKVEERRGRAGGHIDFGSRDLFEFSSDHARFALTPGTCGRSPETGNQLAELMSAQGNRVVLSGIGGDEVTGGVPTPFPELEDLLARAHFRQLARQLKLWALDKRKPWFHLLFETAEQFLPRFLVTPPVHRQPAVWFDPSFVRRNRAAFAGYERGTNLFGPRPSFQENLGTLDGLRAQLGSIGLASAPLNEKRYPYLDRDLLEFLYAIPREQLVRPGQRRSLMRRALTGIVPDEILNRKRKAFVARSPIKRIAAQSDHIVETTRILGAASVGIVDTEAVGLAIRRLCEGQEVSPSALFRTLELQLWLEGLRARGTISRRSESSLVDWVSLDRQDRVKDVLREKRSAS
jgi:asparagine synthase (glutamine-hydrolysing)